MTALRKATTSDVIVSDQVTAAISALTIEDLDRLNAWQPLADLSAQTVLEAVDVEPGSVVFSNDRFEVTANIYVLLNYGPTNDGVSLSDEYIASIRGSIHHDRAVIDSVVVDTSPFYD